MNRDRSQYTYVFLGFIFKFSSSLNLFAIVLTIVLSSDRQFVNMSKSRKHRTPS